MRLINGQVSDFKPLSSLFFSKCNVLESDSISLAQREGWVRQGVEDGPPRNTCDGGKNGAELIIFHI